MASNFQDMTSSLNQNLDNIPNIMHPLNFYAIKCIIHIHAGDYTDFRERAPILELVIFDTPK